jgi:hypothetical protein
MKKLCAVLLAVAGVALCQAQTQEKKQAENHDLGYKDTPMLPGLPFHVHDSDRPRPRVVTPGAQVGAAPSDAIVLFDGKDLSHWVTQKDGSPAKWKVENGYFEVVKGAGQIATKEKFGDMQLHIEWASPAVVSGNSQGRGNSGVFLQGRYEIQVLDSFENPTYADGQAGAIYGQWPPMVNAARKPGEWQTYDIVFEAPRLDGDKVLKPAYVTVIHNGVLLQNHHDIMGPTKHRETTKYEAQPPEDSLQLQDHGNPVRYRNIWVRRLQ